MHQQFSNARQKKKKKNFDFLLGLVYCYAGSCRSTLKVKIVFVIKSYYLIDDKHHNVIIEY